MSLRSKCENGFSLVELLVTALIFGIGLLGLAALQVSTVRSNSGGRNRFTATSLAEACLSSIQAEGSTSWTYSAGIEGNGALYPASLRRFTGGTVAGDFGTFDISGQPVITSDPAKVFTVTWTQNAGNTTLPKSAITGMNLKEFVVTVSWLDQAVDASGANLTPTTLSMSRLIRY